MHLIGDDFATPFDSKGLIKAYAASRSRPQPIDPNVVDNADGGLFVEMFDTGMDDDVTIQRYQTSGDSPPYLLGHDDHDPDDQSKMKAEEDRLLDRLRRQLDFNGLTHE